MNVSLLNAKSNKEKAIIREKLMKNESIIEYIERRKDKAKTEFTEKHARAYLNGLSVFFEFVDKKPDEILEIGKKDISKIESLLMKYFKYLLLFFVRYPNSAIRDNKVDPPPFDKIPLIFTSP